MSLRIAHLTDRHACDPAHDVTTQDDYDLADAVLDDDPDVIIDGGDVVGGGFPEQFDDVRGVSRLYRDSDSDYRVVGGNHCVDGASGKSFARWNRHHWEAYAEDVDTDYTAYDQWPRVYDYGEVRIILVDTCADPAMLARGACGADQIERIAQAVAEWGGPVVMCSHHCPSAASHGLDWSLALSDRRELAAAIHRAGGVRLWLTGHLHDWHVWSSTFGADYLLASGMCAADGRYRRIEVGGEDVRWEVVSV